MLSADVQAVAVPKPAWLKGSKVEPGEEAPEPEEMKRGKNESEKKFNKIKETDGRGKGGQRGIGQGQGGRRRREQSLRLPPQQKGVLVNKDRHWGLGRAAGPEHLARALLGSIFGARRCASMFDDGAASPSIDKQARPLLHVCGYC